MDRFYFAFTGKTTFICVYRNRISFFISSFVRIGVGNTTNFSKHLKTEKVEEEFIEQINRYRGILQKICNIYFYQHPYREDYYQEILIRLWKAYPGFKKESTFSTWLYRVALNAAIDLVRKESIQPVYKELSAQEYLIRDNYSEENLVTDRKEELYRAINLLSDVEKAIIILYLEGYEYKEISAVIGISETNVGVKINRIKKQLIKQIKNGRQ